MHPRSLLLSALTVGLLGACAQQPIADQPPAGQPPAVTPDTPEPNQAGLQGLFNRRTSTNSSITTANASSLQQVWQYQTEALVTAGPLVQDNRVFVTDWAGFAYALDANTGQQIWKNKIENPKPWPWHGLAGTGAIANGMFFTASVEGTLFALDQKTGNVIWKTSITDQEHGGNLSKILFHDGKLFIGLQSVEEALTAVKPDFNELNFQGRVKSYDASTGELLWEKKLVTEPHNGVAVWSSFALDPQTNTLFFTTGNNYTGEPTDLSDSVIAVDASTGETRWVQQTTSQDVWTPANPIGPDYDFGAGPQLFEATINGQLRKLVGAGQKSGIYWVFDRNTGEPVWNTTVGTGGIAGGIRGEASIGTDRILVWSNNSWDDVGKTPGGPKDYPIDVEALDPATGKILWSQPKAQPAIGYSSGILANDVYFVGSLDGTLQAYNAMNGKILWKAMLPAAVGSPLNVSDDKLFVGAGVPAAFGGPATGGNGVYAFSPKAGK